MLRRLFVLGAMACFLGEAQLHGITEGTKRMHQPVDKQAARAAGVQLFDTEAQ